MIMLCDISGLTVDFGEFADKMKVVGDETGMAVQVMHSDIFDSMHRI
jgi:ACT domain-containing protein